MFGYLILRNYMEAMQFDSENNNSKWYDAIKLEMESMLEYKELKKCDKAILDKHKKVTNSPKGYSLWSLKLAKTFRATGSNFCAIHKDYVDFLPELDW